MKTVVTLLAVCAALAVSQPPSVADKPNPIDGDPATRSRAVTDDVLDAVASEMERSKAGLHIEGAENPYFLGYKVTEVEVNDVSASLGSVTDDKERHFVNLEAHVHVGDYQFDNSNFVAPGREDLDGRAEQGLPLEPSPSIASRATWLATDQAYKEALEQIHAKQEALRGGAAGGITKLPSYTKVKPAAMVAPVLVPRLETLEEMSKRAEKISAVFRKEGHVRDSRVSFTSYLERRWLLNSEGNSVHDTRRASGVLIVATGQANDGQELTLYYTRYGITARDLPGDDELVKEAKALASRLQELAQAPLAEPYTGPVLFEADGAVAVLRNTLAPNLSGTPLPVGVNGRDAVRFGGGLSDRIGLKVLSELLTIVDDPTARAAEKQPLIGGYKIDDEGVPAQKVSVVEDGKLTAMLMSRTPAKQTPASNGHARLSMAGGIFRGSTTNLLVTGKGGLDRKALVKKLLAEAKSQGLPYAIIIRQLDDAAITANSELTRFERLQLLQSVDEQAPPPAVLAYRVYPNGKEELVRGVQLKPVGTRAWRDVIAVGKQRTVRNFLATTEDPLLLQVGGAGPGFVPSTGVESAIVTPDLLFRELDVVPSALGQRAVPAIPPP
jgi:hypothetical protein